MKATDLMVNDLVQVDGVVRIATIRTGAVYDYMNKEYSIGCIKPIPITHRILEKNGWEKAIGENPVEVWTIKKGVYLHNTDNGYKLREGAEFNVPNIKYVHQLQRALRCCGLWDLVDNFKID